MRTKATAPCPHCGKPVEVGKLMVGLRKKVPTSMEMRQKAVQRWSGLKQKVPPAKREVLDAVVAKAVATAAAAPQRQTSHSLQCCCTLCQLGRP